MNMNGKAKCFPGSRFPPVVPSWKRELAGGLAMCGFPVLLTRVFHGRSTWSLDPRKSNISHSSVALILHPLSVKASFLCSDSSSRTPPPDIAGGRDLLRDLPPQLVTHRFCLLQQAKGKYQRAVLYVSGDALRVVDEISKVRCSSACFGSQQL